MGMLKEFQEFAIKGNAIDMAVGLVVGAAFGKIVTSLVNDIIMPPIGLLLGKVDFSSLAIHLNRNSDQVWQFHQHRPRLRYCGLRHLPGGQANQPVEGGPEPAVRDCPKCCSSIPVKATRCPHCTSEL